MSKAKNIDLNFNLIETFYNDLWNNFNKGLVTKILDKDLKFRGSLGDEKTGHKGFIEYMNQIQNFSPNFHNEILEVITQGNKSFVKLKFSGTQNGNIFNIKSKNNRFSYYGAAIFKFKNNLIAEITNIFIFNGTLVGSLPYFKIAKNKKYLSQNIDHITRFIEDLDLYREKLQIIKDEISNIISEKLNKNTYITSIVATLFLPIGFLTGLFGVNLGGIPGQDKSSFWIFTLLLAVLFILELLFLVKLSKSKK